MNLKRILFFTGRILVVFSVLMLLPVIVALIYGEYGRILPFVIPASAACLAGSACMFLRPEGKYKASEGFTITALSWVLISVFGCLPFVISGEIPNFIDAFFETVSGFTTTGASIIGKTTTSSAVGGLVENMARSLLFWRSFTHWIGGMGVLAFGIALFPGMKGKGDESGSEAHILRAESPGPTYGKLVSKLRFNTRILYGIYLGLTVLEILFLIFGGMPVFDSVVHSFATAGTGGFSIFADGVMHYNNAYYEMVMAVFMVLFGANFNVYYFMLIRRFSSAFKNEEVKWYFGIIGAATATIMINTMVRGVYTTFGEAFRHSFFQTASIMTTTGFASADFTLWPAMSQVILVLLMFIGACAGSTGGGLKVSRLLILIKAAIREVRRSVKPKSVHLVTCDGEVVEHQVIMNVCGYFIVYVLLTAVSTLIVSFDGFDTTTSFTSVVACFNNIGPGLGKVGPLGTYAGYSVVSKLTLSFDMLFGRLEIFPLLIALAPSAWRNK
ncbi:MAG: TrkH family potassium uptake protein [Clostridia bacterium]|nr:TrkH family potassium uptake protein [Clostridia bacterium]